MPQHTFLYGQADFSYVCERDSHASYSLCLIEALTPPVISLSFLNDDTNFLWEFSSVKKSVACRKLFYP